MSHSRFLIIVGGPTASGKTSMAIQLAQHFNTEILSCDSRQFFREMSIGTAKPSPEERAQAPHHFIDVLSAGEEYSVGDYERDALQLLDQLFEHKKVVIMAGGSGLYQKAVCEGLDDFPEVPLEVRKKLERQYQEEGIDSLQERLRQADPEYYRQVDLQNPHRLIRALSVYEVSGRSFSHFRKQKKAERHFFPIYLELRWDRAKLYERINKRVDMMMEAGLLEEARALYPLKDKTALQTVGYQELFDHFDGNTSLQEAVNLIKRNSRRYAKRQLTWSRRDGHWKHFSPDEWNDILEYVELSIEKQLQFTKEGPSPDIKKSHPFLDHLLIFSSAEKKIGEIWVSKKKNNIYHHLNLGKTYWESREAYFFLHEIHRRLQNNDRLEIPDRMKPFFLERGLISLDNNFLSKK